MQDSHRLLLSNPDLVKFLITDEWVRNIPACALNGLPVRDEGLLVLGLSQPQVSFKGTTCVNRLAPLRTAGPCANLRAYEACERTTSAKSTAASGFLRHSARYRRLLTPPRLACLSRGASIVGWFMRALVPATFPLLQPLQEVVAYAYGVRHGR